MQKSVEIIEFEHAKTGSRWSYVGDAADRVFRYTQASLTLLTSIALS
jgi:hypothetical protein